MTRQIRNLLEEFEKLMGVNIDKPTIEATYTFMGAMFKVENGPADESDVVLLQNMFTKTEEIFIPAADGFRSLLNPDEYPFASKMNHAALTHIHQALMANPTLFQSCIIEHFNMDNKALLRMCEAVTKACLGFLEEATRDDAIDRLKDAVVAHLTDGEDLSVEPVIDIAAGGVQMLNEAHVISAAMMAAHLHDAMQEMLADAERMMRKTMNDVHRSTTQFAKDVAEGKIEPHNLRGTDGDDEDEQA